ncbi:D-ribose pyranase [Paenibacillus cremeus]|uniref:D-ribose pyranase n=1 Tax=Paenibacillus cremeus TaxID=2163881 RepID=A0A559K6V8_9BACL|nr:D-ribose pyranase [Paenibacillus cremeus]TVY07854.1 D-ribose pyranase [Paenibacillus cremeus]
MKKTALLNSEISSVIARMGHMDHLVIADCGLPIPPHVKRIDLALTAGTPGLIETLQIEEAVVASELISCGRPVYQQLTSAVEGTPIRSLPHEDFKRLIAERAVAVIRTGECTPYANVILQSGVTF